MQKQVDGKLIDMTQQEIDALTAEIVVPETITRTQALLTLLSLKITEDQILAQINLIPDDMTKAQALIRFNAYIWSRANPFIASIGAAFGFDSDQLDSMFVAAAQIEV